jgi:hypothetical protein
MNIVYQYDTNHGDVLKAPLGINYTITSIYFNIDFTISAILPCTRYNEAEGGELNVTNQEVMYVCTEDGVPIYLTRKQKEALCDYINYDRLDEACWEAWMAQVNEDDV